MSRKKEIIDVLNNEFSKYSYEELIIMHYANYINCSECPLQNKYCKDNGNNLGCDEIIRMYIHEGEK